MQVGVLLTELKQSSKTQRLFYLMGYYLYILKSLSADKFYTGSSDNPERRLYFHNNVEKGFTSRYRPWEIVFMQEYESKTLALAAERKIKKWKSKRMIEKIISGEIKI